MIWLVFLFVVIGIMLLLLWPFSNCSRRVRGKTCGILPPFLHSAGRRLESKENDGFTHYLYLAFANNSRNYFRVSTNYISKDTDIARRQGAELMFHCLESLLYGKIAGLVNVDEDPIAIQDTINKIKILFSQFGQSRILVHVDEHRQMARPMEHMSDEVVTAYAEFRGGALEVLGSIKQVTAVVTTKDNELKLPVCSNRNQTRLLTILQLRLRLKVKQLGHLDVECFLQNFKKAANEQNVDEALLKCLKLCPFPTSGEVKSDKNATKLLVGVKETELTFELERKIPDMVVVGKLVTSSLERLLLASDPVFMIHNVGQARLREILKKTEDFLSATALEAAYCWSLSCISALNEYLDIGGNRYWIKCKDLMSGRLFYRHDVQKYMENFNKMNKDTIYYVQEGKTADGSRQYSHPLCDIFFKTERDEREELVLIDVTGANMKNVQKKVAKLSTWIDREPTKETNIVLHGIILAPLCEAAVGNSKSAVAVCGDDARHLLGGLQQIL